jgi:outer membrane protein W
LSTQSPMKKIYLLTLCVLLITGAYAQKSNAKRKRPGNFNKPNNENDQFLEKQWWLGFKAGTNISNAVVGKTYTVISSTDDNPDVSNKKYQHFNKWGTQVALEITFTFKQLSLSLQPTYRHSRFVYTNEYQWIDQDPANNLVLRYEQEQKVDHVEIPLLAKYELSHGKLRPYLQMGGYAAFLVNANKSIKVSGTDYASGGVNEFENPPIIVGAKDLFAKNHWGMIGGAGLNYHLGNVRLNLDIMYKYCMTNITSTKNRYSNDRITGAGDAMDDLALNNMAFSLGCLFPMRFLESGFKSFDK